MKKIFIFALFLFLTSSLYCAEKTDKTENEKQYENEKITFEVTSKFDQMMPLNPKEFRMFKGNSRLTLDDFISLSNDPLLLKNIEKVKKIKLAGFTAIGLSGGATLCFLIPAIVFTVLMNTYKVEPWAYAVDYGYVLSGIMMYAMTAASVLAIIVELTVVFSLIYTFSYNEHSVRQAVDKYNEDLRKKLGIIPDLSMKRGNMEFSLSYRF
jgi:hypothetical protein